MILFLFLVLTLPYIESGTSDITNINNKMVELESEIEYYREKYDGVMRIVF